MIRHGFFFLHQLANFFPFISLSMMLGTFLNKYFEKKSNNADLIFFTRVIVMFKCNNFCFLFFFLIFIFKVDVADCKSPDETSDEIPGKER